MTAFHGRETKAMSREWGWDTRADSFFCPNSFKQSNEMATWGEEELEVGRITK